MLPVVFALVFTTILFIVIFSILKYINRDKGVTTAEVKCEYIDQSILPESCDNDSSKCPDGYYCSSDKKCVFNVQSDVNGNMVLMQNASVAKGRHDRTVDLTCNGTNYEYQDGDVCMSNDDVLCDLDGVDDEYSVKNGKAVSFLDRGSDNPSLDSRNGTNYWISCPTDTDSPGVVSSNCSCIVNPNTLDLTRKGLEDCTQLSIDVWNKLWKPISTGVSVPTNCAELGDISNYELYGSCYPTTNSQSSHTGNAVDKCNKFVEINNINAKCKSNYI